MADKKFIRDLNSLIRLDTRTRLKAPASRPAISGGIGIGLGSIDPLTLPDLMYITIPKDIGEATDIYAFDGVNTPKLAWTMPGFCRAIGVVNGVTFGLNQVADGVDEVISDGSSILTATYDPTPQTGEAPHRMSVNSNHIILETSGYEAGDNYFFKFYYHNGVYSHTVTTQSPSNQWNHFTANNEIMANIYWNAAGDPFTQIMSLDGTQLSLTAELRESFFQIGISAASKSVIATLTMEGNYNDYTVRLFNNAGTYIGQYLITGLRAVVGGVATTNGCISDIGISDTAIYLTANSNADSISNNADSVTNKVVAVYSHGLTFTGGLATGLTSAVLVGTVATGKTIANMYGRGNVDSVSDTKTYLA